MKRFRSKFSLRAKLKPPSPDSTTISRLGGTFSDTMWTSLLALKESSAAFPPLSSAVGGVVAVWEIAEVNIKIHG
jgi:hypothetical protein